MLTASFTSRFPTRTEELLLECFSVPTKRLRAHQRQPSFAIVSEIAIGRVDSKERITISSEGTRCAYTVSWATRRNVSSLKRSGKEEWHKTKQGRFPFPISSPFLARSTSISLSRFRFPSLPRHYHFSWPRHFSLGGFSHDWWAFVTILRSQSLSSLLHDGMPATSYRVPDLSTPTAPAPAWEKPAKNCWRFDGPLVVVVIKKREAKHNNGESLAFDFEKLPPWMLEHLSSTEWNWKFHPLRTGISRLAFSR